ncbi:MAG: LapA family protein [Syntrophobacteraceae bacterium]|jgi:uncharacterized integral membrane protein
MKVFKLIVSLIILCLVGLFIYQNMETWRQLIKFKLNLYFFQTDAAKPPDLELYFIILLSAVVGFIVGLVAMLKPYFKTRRLLKRERFEKKQAEEERTMRQARAESHGEALAPVNTGE